jgi:hypothetical protein
MASALHDALVLAWVVVGVTSVLMVASAVELWHGFLVRNWTSKGQPHESSRLRATFFGRSDVI